MNSGVVELPGRIVQSGPVFYGTSDPVPNVSELILTAIVAILCQQPAKFSVYRGGRTEYAKASERYSRNLVDAGIVPSVDEAIRIVGEWFGLRINVVSFETIMEAGGIWNMPLIEIAQAIRTLRPKPLRFCYMPEIYVPDSPAKTIYTNDKWLEKNSLKTVADLHETGGWLSGASIHYSLRRFSEKFADHIHVVPFGTKGDVYRMYDGSGSRFVLAPALHIRPAGAEPEWLPLELRTFAAIIQLWPEAERVQLRDRLVSEVSKGFEGTTQKISLEFRSVQDYRVTIA